MGVFGFFSSSSLCYETCCLFGNISAEEPSESSRSVELASRALYASVSRSLLWRLALATLASRALDASVLRSSR